MSWAEAVTESTHRPTRPIRPSYIYVPPHIRDGGGMMSGTRDDQSSQRFVTESHSPSYGFNNNRFGPRQPGGRAVGRGRGGGGGRGRGRNQWRVNQNQEWNQIQNQNSETYSNSVEISDKFDELEISEETNDDEAGIDFDAYEDIPVKASGDDIPPPVSTFAEIDLGKALNDNIKRCKYVKPTPIQRHAIPIVGAGRDLMACAQTGSGKTAAFCFPIISGISRKKESMSSMSRGSRVACPTALILSPTRELSCQIHDEAKKFAHQTGVKIVVAYGGAPISQQFRNLERGVDILVATPGRLVDMIERERVSLSKIKYLTLDEADRMLDMGFEPQIRKIVEQMDMPQTGARQTLLFSATFPDEIQKLASDFLSNYIFLSVGRVGSSTDRITQRVEFIEDMDKRNHLMGILRAQKAHGTHGKHALTLIFMETKKGADALEHWLSRNGFPATAIHGDKVQFEREQALRSFRSGATPIMVATDVAARGLDISNVSHVINFDLPKAIDDYVHRIGRTGRAGKAGVATAFFNDNNAPLAKALVELMQEAKQEVPDWLTQCAERSSYFGSTGRFNRYRSGGSKFGGHDYRSNYNSSSYGDMDSYAGSSSAPYAAADGGYDYGASDGATDYAAADGGGMDYNAPGSFGYTFDHSTIVATGWD